MKVILGADHGGWRMKEKIKSWLRKEGYETKDVGAAEEIQGDDYVDYAVLVVEELLRESDSPSARWLKGPAAGSTPVRVGPLRGILFCRNGFGMVIVANRFAGVRCGFGFDVEAVGRGRTDDDINCLAIPADYISLEWVKKMVKVFLETSFGGEERYKRRLFKLKSIV